MKILTPQHDPVSTTNDATRLALLWRAFEEAEQRIRELERELDTRGRVPDPRADAAHTTIETLRVERERAVAQAAQRIANLERDLQTARERAVRSDEERASTMTRLDAAREQLAIATAERYQLQARVEDAMHAKGALTEMRARLDEAQKRAKDAEFEMIAAHKVLALERHDRATEAEIFRDAIAHERRAAMANAERALEREDADEARMRRLSDELASALARLADVKRAEAELAHAWRANAQLAKRYRALHHAHDIERAQRRQAQALLHDVTRDWRVAMLQIEELTRMAGRATEPAERADVTDVTGYAVVPTMTGDESVALAHAGVRSNEALAAADVATMHEATRIPAPRLAKLQSLARLSGIPGVGDEWALSFFAAGARSRDDVHAMKREDIITLMMGERGSSDLGVLGVLAVHERAARVVHESAFAPDPVNPADGGLAPARPISTQRR